MEERLELRFAQIDKSGSIEFMDKWQLTEYNNGAFFLNRDDKSLVGRKIIMRNSKEEEVWTSKVMYMKDVFFDVDKIKYNCLSANAINIKNMPNVNDTYYVYIEGTEYFINLEVELKEEDATEQVIEEINVGDKCICDYLKEAIGTLRKESKYTYFHNKASVNFVRFANHKFQFSAVDKDKENIWLEVDYRTNEEESALRNAVNEIKKEFKDLKLVEVSKDEEKFASIAEIIVKN